MNGTTSNGSTSPPGDQAPACELCGGMGFIVYDVPTDHPDFGKAFPCPCRLNDEEDETASRLRRLGGLDALSHQTFDNFHSEPPGLTPSQAWSLTMAYRRASSYAEKPSGWLLLQGTYGCGKTHLAAAIANVQIALGRPVLFVSVPDLLDHLRAAYSPNAQSTYDERFDQVRTAPLVILDDLGAESPTPWAQEKLYQIFNYRYVHQLPTVITTNVELSRLDGRIRSRLTDQMLTQNMPITAPDYRRPDSNKRDDGISSLSLYGHMTFSNFDLRPDLPAAPRRNLKMAYDNALTYAQTLEQVYKSSRDYRTRNEDELDNVGPTWLIFIGGYGCGKTHLAAAIANHFQAPDHPVLFVTVPDLLDHLRATYSPGSSIGYDQRFQEMRRVPLLLLDDLGTESATPWAREKLFQLINHRYVARLPTVFTTAATFEELDPRLASRLQDKRQCAIIGITAPSYRGGH